MKRENIDDVTGCVHGLVWGCRDCMIDRLTHELDEAMEARDKACAEAGRLTAELEQERTLSSHLQERAAAVEERAASAPHPMESAARLVDEWSAANFRTSAERPDPSALLDLVKRLAAWKEGT